MGVGERKGLIKQIEERRGSRLLCCLTSDRDGAQGMISKDFLYRFFLHLRAMPNLERLDVLFFTLGGDTLAAYALSRLVRQYAKTVGVLVPHMCLSGGTLFALGADEIVMTRLGTLSAIDPSIQGPWNPEANLQAQHLGQKTAPVGVESVAGFRKLVTEEWHLDEAGTSRAFGLLAEKVNPILLGDLQRSKEQIVRLATSLMKMHMKAADSERIKGAVETLATGLGSHDYLIGAAEARDDVRLQVAKQNNDLENLILSLYEDFAEEMELGTPFDPLEGLGQQPISRILKIVMIESSDRSDVWERECAISPPGQMQIRRNHWRR
ncbi:MAG: SDH family Clp fold serine proteinase [Acidobacteriaceae bacterium]